MSSLIKWFCSAAEQVNIPFRLLHVLHYPLLFSSDRSQSEPNLCVDQFVGAM